MLQPGEVKWSALSAFDRQWLGPGRCGCRGFELETVQMPKAEAKRRGRENAARGIHERTDAEEEMQARNKTPGREALTSLEGIVAPGLGRRR